MNVNVKSKWELNLVSRKVVKNCKPEFFKYLMSHNARMDKPVLRWMLSCSSNVIKHGKWKLRLYMLYAGMKSNRPFYQVCHRLRLAYGVECAVPRLEMIASFLARQQQFKKYFLECKARRTAAHEG